MMKPVLAILGGHHGLGTGASFKERDEWRLATEDAIELCRQLYRDGIIEPRMEPIAQNDAPTDPMPITRSARWVLAQKPDAVIELHYNSFDTPTVSGHLVCSNTMTPFVEAMARCLDVLPNQKRGTIINVDFLLPKLLDPIPCCLIEPAFLFEKIIVDPTWRPMLVSALKNGLYKYFAGEDTNA
jgi:hypothetical protein